MAFVVAAVLLAWGALVGRVGRRVGTLLAVVPILVWFMVIEGLTRSGALDRAAGDALPVYLLIGLFAFLIGENLARRRKPPGGGKPRQ